MSTDRSVIERSLQAPTAFGELFHRHASGLHRFIARRAGEAVADDVTSETFLIAFERRARFDLSRDDARPWLFWIATNLIHRHRIAEAKTLRTAERFVTDESTLHNPERLEERVHAHMEMKRVAKALRKMPVADRDCLLLFAWEDLSYEQIAEAMSIPVGTVRSRLNRARRALRAVSLNEGGTHERARYAPGSA